MAFLTRRAPWIAAIGALVILAAYLPRSARPSPTTGASGRTIPHRSRG